MVNECPQPVGKCDYDLRRYALEEIEDIAYKYRIKKKTLNRYFANTEKLPEPSYAKMFFEYL